jgi:type VI protein secretion system component VasK
MSDLLAPLAIAAFVVVVFFWWRHAAGAPQSPSAALEGHDVGSAADDPQAELRELRRRFRSVLALKSESERGRILNAYVAKCGDETAALRLYLAEIEMQNRRFD